MFTLLENNNLTIVDYNKFLFNIAASKIIYLNSSNIVII